MWRHLVEIKSIFRLHCDAMLHTTRPFIDFPYWSQITGADKTAKKFNKTWIKFHENLLEERKQGIVKNCDGLFFLLWDNMQEGVCNLTEREVILKRHGSMDPGAGAD